MDGEDIHWDCEARETVYQCDAFSVRAESVRLPDGSRARFDYVVEPDSVVVVPFVSTDELVILEEYRHAVGRVAVGLPGGTIESTDADIEAAARRELREEAGYEADIVETIGSLEPANGVLSSTRHVVRATGCRPTVPTDRDGDETMRVRTRPLEDLLGAIVENDIRDERTVAGILLATQHGAEDA